MDHPWLTGALLVALVSSLWSSGRFGQCRTCMMARGIAGGLPLGWVGAGFYAAALAASLFGPPPLLPWMLSTAAGAHAVLLAMLAAHHIACPACLITAVAAIAASSMTLAASPERLWPIAAAPAGAIAVWRGVLAMRMLSARRYERQTRRILDAVLRDAAPVPAGQARLVIFTRPDCQPCTTLDESLLPALHAQFAGALSVEKRAADAGTPAPTIIVLGAAPEPFIGLPPPELVAAAISRCVAAPTSPGTGPAGR